MLLKCFMRKLSLASCCSVVAHTRRPPPLAFTVSRIQRLTHATEGSSPPCVTAMSTSPTVLEWINQGLPLEPALPLRAFLFGTTKLSFLPTAGIFRHVIPPATFFIETLPSIVWRNSRTGWRSLGFTGLTSLRSAISLVLCLMTLSTPICAPLPLLTVKRTFTFPAFCLLEVIQCEAVNTAR